MSTVQKETELLKQRTHQVQRSVLMTIELYLSDLTFIFIEATSHYLSLREDLVVGAVNDYQ